MSWQTLFERRSDPQPSSRLIAGRGFLSIAAQRCNLAD